MRIILRARDLHKFFGNIHAVNAVNFDLYDGEILAIVGPNGAGKTTLLNLISGIIPIDEGKIILIKNGEEIDITGRSVVDINNLGIARAFQIPNIYSSLSVADNIRVSLIARYKRHLVIKRRYMDFDEIENKVIYLLDIFGLKEKASLSADKLSHGEKKKLDIAIAFASEPNIILLDEPTAGLTNVEKVEIVKLIKELRNKQNLSFILVEHDLDVVRDVADRVMVMYDGKVLALDEPEKVMSMPRVIEAYLGGAR